MCSLCAGRLDVATNDRTRQGMTGTEHRGSPCCPTFADSLAGRIAPIVRTVLEPGRCRYHLPWTAAPAGWFKRGYHWRCGWRRRPRPQVGDSALGLAGFRHLGPRHAARVTGEEIRLASGRKSADTTCVLGQRRDMAPEHLGSNALARVASRRVSGFERWTRRPFRSYEWQKMAENGIFWTVLFVSSLAVTHFE